MVTKNMSISKTLLTVSITILIIGCGFNDPYAAKQVFEDPKVVKLAQATAKGDIETIDTLLANGVNIDSTGKDNLTPLYWAFLYVNPSPEVKAGFEHLLVKGANPMHINEKSKLPLLHMVSRSDDSDYLREILKYNEKLDLDYISDDWVWPTALANAMSARRFNNFKILKEAGANIGLKSGGDETILEKSTDTGTWNYALYLLEQGADYTAGNDKTEWNPEGYSEIVRSLENLNYWDYSGKTSRDEVIDFLKKNGVEVYPYHKEDDPRYNPRPQAYIIEDPEPYFDYEALLQTQSKETTAKYYDNYLTAKKFLTLIRRANAQADDIETFSKKIKFNPSDNFMSLIHWYAIDFFDANSNTTTRYKNDEIIKQLENNRGEFRERLTQLSYIYSQPYPQYSETNFVVTEDEKNLFIRVAANYGLLFTNEETPKLLRIESYNIADM